MSKLGQLIFPEEPRRLPGHRGLKITLRGLHSLAAGILCGAWLFDVQAELRSETLVWVLVSGAAMLLLDLYESGAFLAQLRGLVLLFKLSVLAALPLFGDATGVVLAALFVLAVISSHAPSKLRYLVVFGQGRIRGATSKG